MASNDDSKEIIDGLVDLRERLSAIWQDAVLHQNSDVAYQRFKRWKERAVKQIRNRISEKEADEFSGLDNSSYGGGDVLDDLNGDVILYDNFLKVLIEAIQDDPNLILEEVTSTGSSTKPLTGGTLSMQVPDTKKVFIVHGHDEVNTMRLRDLLRDRFKLEPVILSTRPGKGRTLIEKFEEEAQSCSFAFVLLTPDDQVATSSGEYTQARPNVLFELGWFYGRLGRARVVLLLKGGTKIHSDLDGVSRIEFDKNVEEKLLDLEAELRAATLL